MLEGCVFECALEGGTLGGVLVEGAIGSALEGSPAFTCIFGMVSAPPSAAIAAAMALSCAVNS